MGTTVVIGGMALVLALGIFGLIMVRERYRPVFALLIVFINTLLSSIPSFQALAGYPQSGVVGLPHLNGDISIRIDSLSAWFILIINFTTITGVIYGSGYLKAYSHLKVNRELHWIFYLLFHVSMIWVCMFEHGLGFLISWELMSLSSLMLVIFEFQNKKILKAGINYMVQMHLSVVLLTLGFIWLYVKTGSFNFGALAQLPPDRLSGWVFILLFAGFAIKAGFIPFHTWLPHAHPAAPSHISGVMSGVIVKMGIYGIFRVIMQLQHDWMLFGEIILILSLVTSLYGIANAALKYDFKQMLAYCTIENIGIIGIGIGIGLIGIGNKDATMSVLGFGGALLHTLNHSLFKSLLFFGAGSVYQQTHTRNIEHLGGLIKKMPVTAVMFLIGSMAIGGIPPFNGFVSEFIIYNGLFRGLLGIQGISQSILFILTITGLAIVGGISLMTFTKTFGIVFLGHPRKKYQHEPKEVSFVMLLPQYLIVFAMLGIALVPGFFFGYASRVVADAFPAQLHGASGPFLSLTDNLSNIGSVSLAFMVVLTALFGIRWLLIRKRSSLTLETWGCGYVAPVTRAQYTGQSFTRSFGLLFSFLVREKKSTEKLPRQQLYPGSYSFSTNYIDLLERYLIIPIAKRLTFMLNYFQFIQNGQIQSYVLYGLFFIILIFLGNAFNLIR
jgi:formate hydrogenlyase subunit 3/multisubunit Na+/H+ antiporter MnhD subunit